MKKIIALTVAVFIASSGLLAQNKAGKIDTTQHTAFYTCSMHPDVSKHEPGKCPKCGMELNLSSKEEMKATQSKNYTCPIHVNVTSKDHGTCPKCGRKLALSAKEQMKAEVTKIYTCPMHPSVALDKEGNCPKCGMTLVEKKTKKPKKS